MIPVSNNVGDIEIGSVPTRTYKADTVTKSVRGYADGLDAMKQAIYKILLTERYQYIMYSENYGIETLDLFGEPLSYVCPELERRITEALTQDDRISGVSDFKFEVSRGSVHVDFTVHTVFGDVSAQRGVML